MHPGEVLREQFLNPLALKPYATAKMIGIPRTRVERIANETTGIKMDELECLGVIAFTGW